VKWQGQKHNLMNLQKQLLTLRKFNIVYNALS
jgi:hypothetical protein